MINIIEDGRLEMAFALSILALLHQIVKDQSASSRYYPLHKRLID